MHPNLVSATEGRCPECGMKLMPTAGAPLTFTCPMHPEVVSNEQGKCPHCGMKLMPSSAVSAAGGHGHGHDHEAMDREPHGASPARRPRVPRSGGTRARSRPRRRRGYRVGGRHGRGQPDDDPGEHALEGDRPLDRHREPRHRVAVQGRRPREDPARQRDGLRPPDAPPVRHPRRRPLPGPQPRRRRGPQPRLDRHGPRAHRRGRRHPPRRHPRRPLDGPLPHRRAPRERDDVQLRRDVMTALADPAVPVSPTVSARMTPKALWTLAITSVAVFMVTLDNLVVTTAIPVIREDLHAGLSGLQWTVNAYTLTFAVLLLTGAALGDRFGRRRLLAIGIAIFTAASAAAALAPSIVALDVARAAQGLGGAIVMPLTLTVLSASVPAERRGLALGIWGGISGLAVAFGPLVGGAIVTGISWHWIFWLNVPIGLALTPLILLRLDESRGPASRLDLPGLAL